METIDNYLEGRWGPGTGEALALVNPTDGAAIAEARNGALPASAAAYARTEGGPRLRAMTFAERGAMLERLSGALHEARETLIASSIRNGGGTRGDAKFDVDGAIFAFSHYAELGKQLGDRRFFADGEGDAIGRSPRFWGQHICVPRHGVALLINAYNFPAWGFAEKMATALLAGVPVVTKPATATALTAFEAAQAIVRADALPEGAFSFFVGSGASMLDVLEAQDVVSFTGSADTAARIRSHERVRELSVPVNVEADSLNAAILGPDVELGDELFAHFVREVARELTQKTGQKCTAVRRIFVPSDRVDAVVEALSGALDEIKLGAPDDRATRMGPLVNQRQLDDVRAGVAALSEEADVVYGQAAATPEDLGFPGGAFHPILLLRIREPDRARIVHEREVFGPVASLIAYDPEHTDALLEGVRRGQGGLVASLYTDQAKFAEAVVLGLAPYHGRVYVASSKVTEYAAGSGLVFPNCVHGGPGRAGGGEELGGVRGMQFYMQRTALQGPRAWIERFAGTK